jgi:hypothetical protein
MKEIQLRLPNLRFCLITCPGRTLDPWFNLSSRELAVRVSIEDVVHMPFSLNRHGNNILIDPRSLNYKVPPSMMI